MFFSPLVERPAQRYNLILLLAFMFFSPLVERPDDSHKLGERSDYKLSVAIGSLLDR
jgi:hypothetical protein